MEKDTWSRSQLYVFFGFGSVLCLMIFSIFFNGYASARSQDGNAQEWSIEVQNELSAYDVVPNVTDPLASISPSFDFLSDESYQKYLSNATPFAVLNYVPVDLAPINSNFTANNAKKFQLRQVAGDALADMAWHFWHEFNGDRLSVYSAYRSKSYQDGLIKKGCAANACAKGGTSEHQAGLAVDINVVTKGGKSVSLDRPNKYTDWLHAHAQERGFHNTYQKGVAIDGKIVEGRHWRYMGIELATLLRSNGQTIAEYYKELGIRN